MCGCYVISRRDTALAKRKPLRAVFHDSSYENDSVKINVEQIFKLMSPGTEVKSI